MTNANPPAMAFDPNRVKQYPPVGRCIYCGRSGVGVSLTREHILPYCLGGDAVLRRASCQACTDITKKFEQYCADRIFRSIRVHHGFHSRRKPKTHLPVLESFDSDPVLVPVGLHPGILFLPSFDLPGIVTARNQTVGSGLAFHCWSITDDHDGRVKALLNLGYRGAKIKEEFQIGQFMRLLAKIAHGIAVAEHGIDRFKPLLRDVILESDASAPYYVGCAYDRLPPAVPMKHWARKELRQVGDQTYVIVFLRLFAYIGTPVYCIVVGEDVPLVYAAPT